MLRTSFKPFLTSSSSYRLIVPTHYTSLTSHLTWWNTYDLIYPPAHTGGNIWLVCVFKIWNVMRNEKVLFGTKTQVEKTQLDKVHEDKVCTWLLGWGSSYINGVVAPPSILGVQALMTELCSANSFTALHNSSAITSSLCSHSQDSWQNNWGERMSPSPSVYPPDSLIYECWIPDAIEWGHF